MAKVIRKQQAQPGKVPEEHADRIMRELAAVGVSHFGRMKFSAQYLCQVVHSYEHIEGAVYGHYGSGGFLSRLNEGMLIATDRRVIFLDHKPGYTDLKELSYDIVSGIECLTAGFSSSVTLYTRIGDYTIRNANPRCVDCFMGYVERRRLESENHSVSDLPYETT